MYIVKIANISNARTKRRFMYIDGFIALIILPLLPQYVSSWTPGGHQICLCTNAYAHSFISKDDLRFQTVFSVGMVAGREGNNEKISFVRLADLYLRQ